MNVGFVTAQGQFHMLVNLIFLSVADAAQNGWTVEF